MSFKLRVKTAKLPRTGRYAANNKRSSKASRSIARRRSMSSGGAPSLGRIAKRGRFF